MKVIDQLLGAQRAVGGIVYDAVMAGDWSILSRFEPEHCAPIFPVPERIVPYHYVRRGTLTICLKGQEPTRFAAGTMVLFPRNHAHVICSRPNVPPTPAEQIFTDGGDGSANLVRIEGEGPECALFCGWLGVDEGSEPLLQALPSMLSASASEAQGAFIASSLRYAAEDLRAQPALVARLSQLFFEEAVRLYLHGLSGEEQKRFAALRDPALGRALALIDREYAKPLRLDELATEAGVSRTVLNERFASAFAEAPMRYLARHPMRKAAAMLRNGQRSVAETAFAVGFSTEAAFARAFKREFGLPPAAWRDAHASEGP